MGASYTAWDYLGVPVAILLCGLILFPTLTVLLSLRLARKNNSIGLGFLPVAAMMPLMILLVLWGGPVLTQVGDLMLPQEFVIQTTAGKIEALEPGAKGSWHYVNRKLVKGQMMSLEGQRYYDIGEEMLEPGMVIAITYAHSGNGNVILSWQETSPEEAERIRLEGEASNPELPVRESKEISPEQNELGTWLMRIGLGSFLLSVGLTTFFREKIIFSLLAWDAQVRGEIRISLGKLLLMLGPMGCMVVLLAGICLTSVEDHVWFMVIFALCGVCFFAAAESTTYLRLDGQTLTVRRYGKEKQYSLSEVRRVFWRKTRGFVGQSLVLVMEDGTSYWFNPDIFVGVQDIHTRFSRYMEKKERQA